MQHGHFYIGQTPAEHATLHSNTSWQSSNGGAYTVTDHLPTFHGIGDKANAVQTGTGADVSNFSVTKSGILASQKTKAHFLSRGGEGFCKSHQADRSPKHWSLSMLWFGLC